MRLLLGNQIVDLYIWESLDSPLIPDHFQAEFRILNLQRRLLLTPVILRRPTSWEPLNFGLWLDSDFQHTD